LLCIWGWKVSSAVKPRRFAPREWERRLAYVQCARDVDKLTYREVGHIFGVSRTRAAQLYAIATWRVDDE